MLRNAVGGHCYGVDCCSRRLQLIRRHLVYGFWSLCADIAMVEYGALEIAAGKWLQRLQGDDRLPSKRTLEVLRRREVSARSKAEVLADAEHRCAVLASERLQDERELALWREQALLAAQEELQRERSRRDAAEVALAEARVELRRSEERWSDEATLRGAAERAHEAAAQEVARLKAVISDDTSLEVLDEFQSKLQDQRAEISTLRQRMDLLREGSSCAVASLSRSQQDLYVARQEWACDRMQLARSRDEAVRQLCQLRDAGAAVQAAAEGTVQLCMRLAADAVAARAVVETAVAASGVPAEVHLAPCAAPNAAISDARDAALGAGATAGTAAAWQGHAKGSPSGDAQAEAALHFAAEQVLAALEAFMPGSGIHTSAFQLLSDQCAGLGST